MLALTMDDTALRLQAVATYVLYRTVHHVRRLTGIIGLAREQYVKRYLDQMLHEATRDDGRLRHCCRMRAGGSATSYTRKFSSE